MIIPSQLPQIVTAARSGALQALALQAGQVIDGRVLGPAPNGGTQVQISGQLLNLVLPQAAKAGETLRFEVQGSGAQIRLALQTASAKPLPATPTTAPTPQAAASTPGSATAPATAAPPTATPQPQTAPTAPAVSPAAAAAPTGQPVSPTNTAALPQAAPASAPPPAAPAQTNAANPQVSPGAASPASSAPSPAAGAPVVATGQASSVPTTAAPVPRQAAPYAQATPASPAASTAPSSATATATAAAATGRLSNVVPVAATPGPAVPAPAALPSTPQAALAQMVQGALPQQNSIVSLTAALTSVVGQVALPEPVARAAQQVLANQLVVGGAKLDGSTLQRAVLNSGVFQEAALARAGVPLLAPQADMKAAMLALRQTLTTWLGQQTPLLTPVAQIAPPLRGQVPRARGLEIPPVDPAASGEDIGKQLLERTESALSRVRLHQHASLPDPHVKGADWSADLPVVIGGHQTLLQLQIHRDEHSGSEESGERGWQMRFAINLPGLGEVGAQVSLRGSATGVMLWAAERPTSDALEADIDGLRDSLVSAGLSPGAVLVRHGAPPAQQQTSSSGHIVDSRR